jgi:hypothetical protein
MAEDRILQGFQQGISLGSQLGLRGLEMQRQDELLRVQQEFQQQREERQAKIADRKAGIDAYAGLANILKAQMSPGMKKVIAKQYMEHIGDVTGKPIDPTVIDAMLKGNDEDHQMIIKGLGAFLSENQQVGAGLLLDALQDPQEAMKLITQGVEISNKREDNERQSRKDQAMQAHQQAQLAQQERHQRVMEGISGGNLAVSRANLGLRQQEIGLAKSTNPAERFAGEMFNTPYGKLAPDERAQVNARIKEETLERVREEGKAKADVAMENVRYTPQQQTQLQSLNEALTAVEAIKEVPPEKMDRWVGLLTNPVQRAKQLIAPDPEFQEFQTLTNQLRASLVFSRTEGGGGALTPTELGALEGFVPSGKETGGRTQIEAKLAQLQRRLQSKLSTIEGLGRAKPGEASGILQQRREESRQSRTSAGAIEVAPGVTVEEVR